MGQLPFAEKQRPVVLADRAADAPVHPLINHRYAIIRKIDEKGSDEIFLVADILRNNRRHTIKVLRGRGKESEVDEEVFRNEVSPLVRLHHPHLVRVLDFGRVLHASAALVGRRFVVMEYVEGTDLLTWCRSIGDIRSRHISIRAFLLQILSALDYIHREGVIHYDIKPDNLLVVGDDSFHSPSVKLTDFGFSQTRSENNIHTRGTLEYTAPELLRGEEHDARVDLYSLGVTLYQLLEGFCPFRAATRVELIQAILTARAAFPAPGKNTDSGLHSIAQTLLSRNPAQRFLNARAAARAVSGTVGNDQSSTDIERNLRPTFVGRADELSAMKQVFHLLSDCCRDRETDGQIPLEIQIIGIDGSGKTALLERAVTEARKFDLQVIALEEYDPKIPFQAVSTLLRVLYAQGLSHSHQSRNTARKLETLFIGDVATKDIAPAAHGGKEFENIISTIVRCITEWSALFPFVLVLDDADRLDRESRMAIDGLCIQGIPGRLLIIETTSEAPPPPKGNRTVQIVLPDLGPDEAVSMSRSVFGSSPFADELGRFLHSQYGGMPAVLVEGLHAVVNMPRNEHHQSRDRVVQYVRSLGDGLPQDLDQFLMKRVRSLNRESQIIIEFLSCFRNPVRIDILESLLPYRAQRARQHRFRLELYGYVTLAQGFQRCAIRQERLKAAVYKSLASTWAELHGYIAKGMQHLDIAGSQTDLEELAYQLSRCGDHARASLFFEQAGDAGLSNSSFDNAIRLFQEALSCNEMEKSRARTFHLKLRIASSQLQAGLFKESIETAEGLLDDSTGSARAELLKVLGVAQSRIGHYEIARMNLAAALAESSSASDQLELRQELIGIDIALGNFAEAEGACRIQLEKAREIEDENVRAGILTDLGTAIFHQNRFDEAASCFRESMETYSALHRPMKVIDALCNLGNVLSAKGDNIKAIGYWNTALQDIKEYGTPQQQVQLLNAIGIAYFRLKNFFRARERYRTAHDIALRIGSLNHQARTLTHLGELAFTTGEYEQALTLWTEAQAVYEKLDDGQGLTDTLLQLAELHLVLGNTQLADDALVRAAQLIREQQFESFTGRLAYLQGLRDLRLLLYDRALAALNRSIDAFAPVEEGRNYHIARVRKAECLGLRGDVINAAALLGQMVHDPEMADYPQVFAEALYLMGKLAKEHPATIPENTLTWFRDGLSAITSEPVSDISWRLPFSLGMEYHQRGDRERAHEFLEKARLVLRYSIEKFASETLRAQYLNAGGRKDALDVIAAITQH